MGCVSVVCICGLYACGVGGLCCVGIPLVLDVPMLAQSSNTWTMANGATGAYNSYYVTLGQQLVAHGWYVCEGLGVCVSGVGVDGRRPLRGCSCVGLRV